MNILKTILLLVFILLLPACKIVKPVIPETGHYYLNQHTDFSHINRVVVFEFENHSTNTDLSMTLTEAVTEALGKKHLFSISSLSRSGPAWRKLDLHNEWSYSTEELSAIRQQLKTDAVLFGSITRHRPYPHLLVALHLKMVNLRQGDLIWAIEQVWDSADKRVERRMKKFFKNQMRTGYGPMDWELLITSPRAFNKFVVYEISETFEQVRKYGRAF